MFNFKTGSMFRIAYAILLTLISLQTTAQTVAAKTKTHSVFFETEKFDPNNKEKAKLENFLKSIDTLVVKAVRIVGFCDDVGENPFNDSLSVWRAKTVRQLVTKAGYSATMVKEVQGMGEIALKTDESERSKNRRVDIVVVYSGTKKPKPELVEKPKPVIVAVPDGRQEKTPEIKHKEIFTADTKVGDKIVLENILFEGGRHFMLPESEPHLRHLLKTLQDNPKYHIMILGHICCEKIGRDGYDFDTGLNNLSVARARVIYEFLKLNGIDAKRLAYKGMKSDYKLGKGDKYDRRVEIEITKIVE